MTDAKSRSDANAYLSAITFVDGTSLTLSSNSLVVFCGPNNAGKSRTLREIKSYVANHESGRIIKTADLHFPFKDQKEVTDLLRKTSPLVLSDSQGQIHYCGVGYDITDTNVGFFFSVALSTKRYGTLIDYFTSFATTVERITDSDPPKSLSLLRAPPKHPIHALQYDERLLQQMSSYFRRAFDQDLIVHHGAGGEVPLYVGGPIELLPGEHPLSFSYMRRLESSASPLHDQGDGMRSFVSVMLKAIAQTQPTMIFIDEPEAFLHPPQAKLIGEFLASERRPNVQIFVATHSSDFLEGILKTSTSDTDLVRIQRSHSGNQISVLDKDAAREIATEPLTRYSNILDGIFHHHVVVCEAETDSAFYNALMDIVSENRSSDILFVHGNGKASLAKVVRALTALHVPVSCIVDIDVLNEEKTFRTLFESLGGDWDAISSRFKRFQRAVEQRSNFLKVGDVRAEIAEALGPLKDNDPLTTASRKRIAEAVARSSPWEFLKTAGRHGIQAGQMIEDFDVLMLKAAEQRLWIVPVGEVESFCKTSLGGHGPSWLRGVLGTYDLASANELGEARAFVTKVYEGARQPTLPK